MSSNKSTPTVPEIQTWLIAYIAQILETTSDQIDITVTWDRYGLDSSAAVGMIGDLSEWLAIDLEPELLEDCPTIQSLGEYCGNLEETIL
jgi:acyl carrier protein